MGMVWPGSMNLVENSFVQDMPSVKREVID
jgi:hypothetical protein